MTTTLTLTASEFRALVTPVLPLAGKDDSLSVLTAVLVETQGKWLSATATDRFRAGIKRIPKRATEDDPTEVWPEFTALIPTRVIRSLLATFKPRRGTLDPDLILTVEDNKMTAEAVGLFDLFDAARFTHTLQDGEFPKVRSLFKAALDTPTEERSSTVGLNPAFFADFKATGAHVLRFVIGKGDGKSPVMVTDDEGFIGMLMPRRHIGSDAPSAEDWADFLAPPKAEPKKRATRKPKAGAA